MGLEISALYFTSVCRGGVRFPVGVRLFWIFLALLPITPSPAQTVIVRDAQSLEPLPFVTIYSLTPAWSTTTDASGRAALGAFPEADSLRFRYLGYDEAVLARADLAADDFRVYLQHDPLTLDEVVVAANRWEQDRREVPFTLEHIAPRKVALLQPQTAADFLGASDRVYIQKSQMGGGSPMIRGFAANRVLLVVDGVRMNNAIFRSGNLQNVISIDPQVIEEAEVIFGPASVMYGSDALGGVMDFHTLDPPLAREGERVSGGHGLLRFATANRERTAHGDIHLGSARLGALTSMTVSDYGDLRMGAHGPDDYLREAYVGRIDGQDSILLNDHPRTQRPTGYRQLNLMQKLRYQPSDAWDLRYAFHVATTSDIPRYDRLIEKRDGRLRYADWYYGPQRWLMTNLSVRHEADSPFFARVKGIAAYQVMEESRHDRSLNDPFRRDRRERVRALTFLLDFDAPLSEKLELFYGGELVFNTVGSRAQRQHIGTGQTLPASTRYPDGSTWNTAGLYANLKANPDPNITLMAGLRYAHVSMRASFDTTFYDFPFSEGALSKGALTGSLGAVFRPNAGTQWHLNLSNGFRAPNIDDLGKVFDSEPGSVVVPNPDLAPEYAYTVELALIQSVGSRVQVELALFHTWLDNAMVRRNDQLGGRDSILYDGTLSQVQAIQNAAEARIWGIEGSLDWRLTRHLHLSTHLTWQDGFERAFSEGETVPVRHVAPLFGASHLRLQRDRWQVDLNARYNGAVPFRRLAPSERNKPALYARDAQGRPHAPAWYTLNLALGWQLNGFLQLQGALENITNQRYRPYSSGIAAPGRNLVLAVRATW